MINFPYNAIAGVPDDPAETDATILRDNLAWIARLANEMNGQPTLDLKRCMQIVFHMRKYCSLYAKLAARIAKEGVSQDADWPFLRPAGEVSTIVFGVLAGTKLTWATKNAMLSDLSGLNTACQTFADWIVVNATQYQSGYTTGVVVGNDSDGAPVISDTSLTIAMPAAFQTRVATLRGLFGN